MIKTFHHIKKHKNNHLLHYVFNKWNQKFKRRRIKKKTKGNKYKTTDYDVILGWMSVCIIHSPFRIECILWSMTGVRVDTLERQNNDKTTLKQIITSILFNIVTFSSYNLFHFLIFWCCFVYLLVYIWNNYQKKKYKLPFHSKRWPIFLKLGQVSNSYWCKKSERLFIREMIVYICNQIVVIRKKYETKLMNSNTQKKVNEIHQNNNNYIFGLSLSTTHRMFQLSACYYVLTRKKKSPIKKPPYKRCTLGYKWSVQKSTSSIKDTFVSIPK